MSLAQPISSRRRSSLVGCHACTRWSTLAVTIPSSILPFSQAAAVCMSMALPARFATRKRTPAIFRLVTATILTILSATLISANTEAPCGCLRHRTSFGANIYTTNAFQEERFRLCPSPPARFEDERLRQAAEKDSREQEAKHRLALAQEANRVKQLKAQQELEQERLEAQEREAKRRAELEKERITQEAQERARRAELAEAARLKRVRERLIEQDHETILAYMRQNLPVSKNLKNRVWNEPVRAS